jgi:hypothetical protein
MIDRAQFLNEKAAKFVTGQEEQKTDANKDNG